MGGAYGLLWVPEELPGVLNTVGRPHAAATSLMRRRPALLMKPLPLPGLRLLLLKLLLVMTPLLLLLLPPLLLLL